jgi:hypothetical protein
MSSIMIYDVFCHEMTMYCCEDYGLSSIMVKLALCLLYACIYYVTNLFSRLPIWEGRQNMVYNKIQYIRRLTEKRILVCSSINRGTYATRGRGMGRGQTPRIIVGDVEPMNIHVYIHRY